MDSSELSEQMTDNLRAVIEDVADLNVRQTTDTDYSDGSAFTMQCEDGAEYIVTVECTVEPKWLRDAETYALMHEGEHR